MFIQINNDLATLDKVYPIGSVYLSFNSTNPSTLFGGTWEQIEQGRFLLSAGSSYSSGSKGGSSSVTSGSGSGNVGTFSGNTGSTALTVAQLPSHSHTIDFMGAYGANSGPWGGFVNVSGTGSTGTNATGSGQGHTHTMNHTHSIGSHTHSVNITPPYIAVYMWKRIS